MHHAQNLAIGLGLGMGAWQQARRATPCHATPDNVAGADPRAWKLHLPRFAFIFDDTRPKKWVVAYHWEGGDLYGY